MGAEKRDKSPQSKIVTLTGLGSVCERPDEE